MCNYYLKRKHRNCKNPSFCDSPKGFCVTHFRKFEESEEVKDEVIEIDDGSIQIDCCICLERINKNSPSHYISQCIHHFHRKCFMTWYKIHKKCPICRTSNINYEDEYLNRNKETHEEIIDLLLTLNDEEKINFLRNNSYARFVHKKYKRLFASSSNISTRGHRGNSRNRNRRNNRSRNNNRRQHVRVLEPEELIGQTVVQAMEQVEIHV